MKTNENKPKIWKEEYKQTGSSDSLYLKLEETQNKDIVVCICDKNGETTHTDGSNILCFDFDYKVVLLSQSVNENFPLKTDYRGTPLVELGREVMDHHKESIFIEHMLNQAQEQLKEQQSKASKH